MINILIIDNHPIVSEALGQLIMHKTSGEFRVVGTTRDISEAVKLISELKPDLVIVDVFIGDSSGFDFVRALKRRFSQLRILMLSMHDEAIYAERAIAAGADGYIMKQESSDDIIRAISQILQGHFHVTVVDVLYVMLVVMLTKMNHRITVLEVESDVHSTPFNSVHGRQEVVIESNDNRSFLGLTDILLGLFFFGVSMLLPEL